MVLEIEGRSGNRFEVLGSPLKLSETPVAKNPAPPPRLAEHTDQILDRVLGIDPSRRDALREAGVIR
jgi:crotonobetainyl-CoA:carnitine CoA-transferase CaiB-like acyl-CoA transferase